MRSRRVLFKRSTHLQFAGHHCVFWARLLCCHAAHWPTQTEIACRDLARHDATASGFRLPTGMPLHIAVIPPNSQQMYKSRVATSFPSTSPSAHASRHPPAGPSPVTDTPCRLSEAQGSRIQPLTGAHDLIATQLTCHVEAHLSRLVASSFMLNSLLRIALGLFLRA
jgi:hypothetical protein